jgi:hypothetical protein
LNGDAASVGSYGVQPNSAITRSGAVRTDSDDITWRR